MWSSWRCCLPSSSWRPLRESGTRLEAGGGVREQGGGHLDSRQVRKPSPADSDGRAGKHIRRFRRMLLPVPARARFRTAWELLSLHPGTDERLMVCCSTWRPSYSTCAPLSALSLVLAQQCLVMQVSGGFLEGIVRGYKAGLLTQNQYNNLTQCETIEGMSPRCACNAVSGSVEHLTFVDFRTQLSATDYGNFLSNEPLPISTSTISDKATQVLVDQFNFLRSNATEPLNKFLQYMTWVHNLGETLVHSPDVMSCLQVCIHDRQCHPHHYWHSSRTEHQRVASTVPSSGCI